MYKLAKWNGYGTQGINKLDENGNAIMFIPADSANADYQAYLAWLNEGNVPLPAEES
jgi:hypothetical protein